MKSIVTILIILISLCVFSFAVTINVPGDQSTIQAGIDVASTGDTVLVQTGTYVENINFKGKAIVVISADGPEQTIIDGNQNGSVVLFISSETRAAVLEGFTIQNGNGYTGSTVARIGGGILCRNMSCPTLRNLIVMNNSANGADCCGGGIACSLLSNALVEDVVLKDNISYVGGGIASYYSNPVFRNITMYNNSATYCGGGILVQESDSTVFDGLLIYDNDAISHGGGIFIYTNGTGIFRNMTLVNNIAGIDGSGFVLVDNGNAEIKNSIVWNNDIYFYPSAAANAVTISYSDIQGGKVGIGTNNNGKVRWDDGNIDADPLFTDEDDNDYSILTGSPCIGTGCDGSNMGAVDPNFPEWTDLSGEMPEIGVFVDMAFDYNGNLWMLSLSMSKYLQLTQFDGTNWTVYLDSTKGYPDYRYSSLVIDMQNNIWISTQDYGLIRFDGEDWTVFNKDNSGLPSNSIITFTVDQNNVKWISTSGGLAKYIDNVWTVYNSTNSPLPLTSIGIIKSIAIDSENVKWFGFTQWEYKKMFSFDDSSWTAYSSEHFGDVRSLVIDKLNNKWFAPGGGSLVKFDGVNCIEYFAYNSGLPESGINSITIDGQDNIWIGTGGVRGGIGIPVLWGEGLVKFDGTNWVIYNTSNSGIPNDYVASIVIDDDGNLWMSTVPEGCIAPIITLSIFRPESTSSTGVRITDNNNSIPNDYTLYRNYPNPFNPITTIPYELPKSSHVTISIFDICGHLVETLVNSSHPAGKYQVHWNASNYSTGMYFYRIETPEFSDVRKMILAK